jgi:hypothetical protein
MNWAACPVSCYLAVASLAAYDLIVFLERMIGNLQRFLWPAQGLRDWDLKFVEV